MYPTGELRKLEERKARLRARIERRRVECIAESRRLVEPLERIDRWRERLRQVGPYLPFGLAIFSLWRGRAAKAAEPPKPRGGLLRWLPVVFQGVRAFQNIKNGR
jgi:hypothetical protein